MKKNAVKLLVPNGSASRLARPHAGRVAHRGHPDVHEEAEHEPGRFQKAPHGYDSRMPRRTDIDRLTSEMEELFADLWYHRLGPQRAGFRPRVDVYRTENPTVLHVVAELPGIDPSQVELAINEGVLVISGRRQRQGEGRRYEHIEIDYGPFERRIAIGDRFDPEAAEAAYQNGLLTIALPLRTRRSGPVRVPVTESEAEQ
jgi:HSP20 family protein